MGCDCQLLIKENNDDDDGGGSPYCRAEMYVGRVACCLLVSHGEYADETDRQTPDR